MSIRPQDVLLYAGGECLQKFGALGWRTSPQDERAETHVRTSVGYFVGSAGAVRIAAAGVPRVEWLDTDADGVFETPVLLLERAATNVALRAEEIDHAAWSDVGTPVVTADAAEAPDGATTAETIEDNDAASVEGRRQTVTIANDSTSWCFSVFVKKDATSSTIMAIQLSLTGGTQVDSILHCRLTDGAVLADTSAGTDGHGAETVLDDSGNTWYRFWVVADNNTSGNTSARFDVWPAYRTAFDGGASEVARTQTVTAWGAQLENADHPSTYAKTVGSTFARSADELYYDFPWVPQALAVYLKVLDWPAGLASAAGFHIGSATAATNPRLLLDISSSGLLSGIFHNGTASQSTGTVTAPTEGQKVEALLTLSATGVLTLSVSKDDGAASTPSAGSAQALPTAWADERLYINSAGTTLQGIARVAALKVVRGVQTLADMRALFG